MVWTARQDLLQGVASMREAQQEMSTLIRRESSRVVLERVIVQVNRAHASFAAADDRLTPLSPILSRLGWVPHIGPELSVAPAAAHFGRTLTGGTRLLLHGLRPVSAPSGGRAPALRAVERRLVQRHSDFQQACILFRRARQERLHMQAVRSASLSSALRTADQSLPPLLRACRGLALLPVLLGYSKPQTYLIAYQDSQELRPTGGFIAGAGLLTLKDGSAAHRFESVVFAHENFTIPSPEPMRLYNVEPYWMFRDSNWSPDFPTTAALERFFLKLDTGQDVDGVINVTAQGASYMLRATGPIYAPEYHRWITSANVGPLADYYADRASSPGPYTSGTADFRRKQFIAIVVRHLLTTIEALPSDRILRLGREVINAMTHRALLVAFRNPSAEELVRDAGLSGRLDPTTSDYLYIVDTNLSYNRINPYVHLSATYQVLIRTDRWLDSRLTVVLRNATPSSVTGGIGPGAGSLGSRNDYATFLRIYVPRGAKLIDQSGWTQPWTSGAAYGKEMLCGYLLVPRGATRAVKLHYVVPSNVFSWSRGRTYRLVIQHQPGSHPESVSARVETDGSRLLTWTLHRPTTDASRSVRVPPRSFSPIPLPRQGPSSVEAGRWIEPHAFLYPPRQ